MGASLISTDNANRDEGAVTVENGEISSLRRTSTESYRSLPKAVGGERVNEGLSPTYVVVPAYVDTCDPMRNPIANATGFLEPKLGNTLL
jgi:cytosine/adenosine deaminase-related metal-dependent hydrolase